MDKIWTHITQDLAENLTEPGLKTFLSSATPVSLQDSVLTLEVPNRFSQDWIKEKCEQKIKDVLELNGFMSAVVNYQIASEAGPSEDDGQLTIFPPKKDAEPVIQSVFNERYTFDQYIVGHNNRFAYAASEAVSKAPSKAYNPLFIYGSVGLGKTHLLHAIGLEIQKTHPELKVQFVSSEKFTNDMINAIKDKKVDQFRDKYRKVDVLLVDDIQFLAGKEQTQEEFFHTFNDLHGSNKQIIITSDRPPKEIPTLELRLRTRFEWGLIADMQPPEFETRIAILRKKIELNGFSVSDDILHFIATQIPTNVREMEGALTRIVAYASLLDTEVTLSIASNVIRDMVGIKQERPLSIAQIKRKVSDYFKISETDLISKNRSKDVAYSRQIAMYLARELTNVSLPQIGKQFGKRDHSTVMHAVDKIKSLMETDSETKTIVNILISNIKHHDE